MGRQSGSSARCKEDLIVVGLCSEDAQSIPSILASDSRAHDACVSKRWSNIGLARNGVKLAPIGHERSLSSQTFFEMLATLSGLIMPNTALRFPFWKFCQ